MIFKSCENAEFVAFVKYTSLENNKYGTSYMHIIILHYICTAYVLLILGYYLFLFHIIFPLKVYNIPRYATFI